METRLALGNAAVEDSRLRHGNLCCLRRCRCTHIAHIVSKRCVRLMAHSGNDGNHGIMNRAHDKLFVECPEVFHRSAASADDQKINRILFIEEANGSGDFRRRPLPLDKRWAKCQADFWVTPFGNTIDVSQHCT